MLYSSGDRPATAFSPMLGTSLPSYTHTSVPSGFLTLLGARSFHLAGTWWSHMSGGSTTWSSTLTRIMSSRRIPGPPSRAADANVRLAPGSLWLTRPGERRTRLRGERARRRPPRSRRARDGRSRGHLRRARRAHRPAGGGARGAGRGHG